MLSPDRERALRLCTTANVLAQSLERELIRLDEGFIPHLFQEMYDAVYLPPLSSLSYEATTYMAHEEWRLLCEPLHLDLAETQIRIVLEVLDLLVLAC